MDRDVLEKVRNEATAKAFLNTIGCLALIISWPIEIVFRGWVLTLLWAWFAVPVFGWPELGLAQAIGIGLLARLLVSFISYSNAKPDDEVSVYWQVAYRYGYVGAFLGLGWIVQRFV